MKAKSHWDRHLSQKHKKKKKKSSDDSVKVVKCKMGREARPQCQSEP